MMEWTHKKVTILGAQRSGLALAKLVTHLGGKAKISEMRGEHCLPEDFKAWARQHSVAFEFGGHTPAFIGDSDCVVLSPGVSIRSPVVDWAQAGHIPVLGEIEFAFQFCAKPVIAVTGSNGKTTVVTLIHEVLKMAGYRLCLCGNVGTPFAEYVLGSGDKDFFVLEVSSFQMESLLEPSSEFRRNWRKDGVCFKGFKPYIAVILNFSQNHLDRHNDLQEYFNAKTKIFLNQDAQDYAVLNARDERLTPLASQINSRVKYFNSPADFIGKEDNPNFSAVRTVAEILGISQYLCEGVLRSFRGVEHRMEWVREVDGVNFINDSKATTAQAAVWALERLNSPVVMICGGRDKNIDFSVTTPLVRKKVRKMLAIGEAREKLKRTFDGIVDLEECPTLENAVHRAREVACQGDCVLLSPMCASFDMFANYEERGRRFKDIVRGLI
jgi:UDP-N-acetylmuramoylalanine--D-glutamate ligase